MKFFMLVGLPGSGKSTFGNALASEENAKLFSSDELRNELLGSEDDQSANSVVFSELHKRILKALEDGESVIYDATNISSKNRKNFLQRLNKYDIEKRAVIFATPYEECLRRNAGRDRVVPDYAIKKMYMNFQVPCLQEGFTDIQIVYPDNFSFISYKQLIEEYKAIPHDNPHHEASIGNHMQNALDYLIKTYDSICDIKEELLYATYLHDIGKPFTKTFTNSHGEVTPIAHYYNHNNVGAYDVLLTDIPENIKLTVSLLIQYHMQYYTSWKQSEKAQQRDRAFLGLKFISLLDILHECDLAAH